MGDMKSPTSSVVLGKRKRQPNLVLQLSGGSSCESDIDAVSEFSLSDYPLASTSKGGLTAAPIIVNGRLVVDDKKRYRCIYEGCNKSYRKPCRLEEHERIHTGERPFVCTTCQKSYLRESHLQAHSRSHLPSSLRPFACPREDCDKRFWTAQHLKRHEEMHAGENLFKCTEGECSQTFSKHNQLRAHIATCHCLSGTKPFRCESSGCIKSFSTNQKLRAHAKTHEERRYVCSHPSCTQKETQIYFPIWSALQSHTRTAHPAKCPYPSCNGKTFSQQKGLRAHLKIHEQREVEITLADAMRDGDEDADDEDEDRQTKRRRGGEVGRDWKCEEEGCEKDFKSKKALTTHVNVSHLLRRDFMCTVEGCGSLFGYKHLLQRHAARMHSTEHDTPNENIAGEGRSAPASCKIRDSKQISSIDILTGKAYEDRAKERLVSQKALVCPFSDVSLLSAKQIDTVGCKYVFSRAYDLRRHLSSAHGHEVDREQAIKLVTKFRRQMILNMDGC